MTGFEHNLQSLRVVDFLKRLHQRYDGLFCFETREEIARRPTQLTITPTPLRNSAPNHPWKHRSSTCDPGLCAHDLEDALNAGYLRLRDLRNMENPW
ncbi:hypothetical protein [Syntrophus sp. (in: bacteria)]|uniref:hypothetical protein n=1 Tax=Syntrophus sp. (in: bacteria) TaxID=48412 RepID=UPI00345F1329